MWDKEAKLLTTVWGTYVLLSVLFCNDMYVFNAILSIL